MQKEISTLDEVQKQAVKEMKEREETRKRDQRLEVEALKEKSKKKINELISHIGVLEE